jgi:predicted dienelactone hydrolase
VARRFLGGLSAAGLLLGVALGILFPVPQMPAPTGPHAVGTTSLRLTDAARDEAFTDAPDDKRTLMVQIWYPTDAPDNAARAPWLARADVMAPAIAAWVRLPSFAFNHAGLVRSNSVADAPLSASQAAYPVLLYSHGWGGFRQINATQNEALASHGYVVVSIDHPYAALGAAFDDGSIVLNKRALLPPRSDAGYWPAAQLLESIFSRDAEFVLNELERLNDSDARFGRRLDLTRVGIFGHSTGGGAMIQLCARDKRCKALVGQDAWVDPIPDALITAGLTQPTLFMRSEQWTGDANDARLIKLNNASSGSHYRLSIKASRHYDFVMIPLFSPLAPWLGLKGPIPAGRIMPLIDDFMIAFFDTHLKGASAAVLDAVAARYPEAIVDRK